MEQAIRRRAAAKGWLSRANTDILELIELIERNQDVSETKLADTIEQFNKRLSAYDEAQAEVELNIDLKDLDQDIEEAAEFRKSKRANCVKANELLMKMKSQSAHDDSGSISNSVSSQPQVRLPQIELPKFSGDFTSWQSFWDRFKAVVDNTDLAPVTKFTYLQAQLRGDAAAAIAGLALTEANYTTACDILQKRFGRKERIVFDHIQQLLNISVTGRTVECLWTLYDCLQSNIRSLETLGITGETYGVILTPLVLHRLPENVRLEWARTSEGKESDLEGLMQFLFSEIQRRERSKTFQGHTSGAGERGKHAHASATALHSSAVRNRCHLCAGRHITERCFKFRDMDKLDRRKKCLEKGLCFVCLEPHLAKNCQSKNKPNKCQDCKTFHHHLLSCKTGERSPNREQDTQVKQVLANHGAQYGTRRTVLQIVRVTVKGHCHDVEANVLFDSGSDRSYISSSFVQKVKPKCVGQELVSVALFGDSKPHIPKLKKTHEIKVACLNGNTETLIVMESPVICAPVCKPKLPKEIFDRLETEGIDLQESLVNCENKIEIDLLVGLDYYWNLVMPRATLLSPSLSAQETKFGYILSGSWETDSKRSTALVSHQCCIGHKFWDLETLGISDSSDDCKAVDEKVLEHFNKTVEFSDGRYVVRLPYKDGQNDRLINNENIAKKRCEALTRKLDRDPALKADYNQVLTDMETSGVIHEVPPSEKHTDNPTFYLPHRPVIREASATTKIRPVFDASTKGINGYSLNDCMETGPNLIPNLVEVLLRFRRWKYGLTADISKAFLQIRVCKQDQDVHRFLWDINDQVRVMRFDRVVFGNASSPFLLNATVKFHLNQFDDTKVVEELKENLYVDDWLSGSDSQEEIVAMVTESEKIMGKGGFPLAKWGSNSSVVNDRVFKDLDNNSLDHIPCLKILGLSWSTVEDSFLFETFPIIEGLEFTKRLVLSFIARIYDPLGFLNPFVIGIKIMFQQIWRLGLSWDDPLPSDMQKQMSLWFSGLQEIKQWKIPRCLAIDAWTLTSKLTLLGYSDASEKAYGGCVYLRVSEGDATKVSLVISKVRVAPLKRMTLPRLELMGALVVARLIVFVRKSLRLPQETPLLCFSDSTIVLSWIKADPNKWKQFVGNRVSEIQSLTSPSSWVHCSGKSNPADLITRGITAGELVESECWIHGSSTPDFDFDLSDTTDECCLNEEALVEKLSHDTILTVVEKAFVPLITYERFSQFSRLVRVMAWVKRFIFNISHSHRRLNKILDQHELREAESFLLLSVQREAYPEEIRALKENKSIGKKSSLYKLHPFLGEDGFLRAQSRLQMSDVLSFNEKHPIILPKCHVSLLLVKFQHYFMKHAGVTTLISCLRDKYWIIGLRRLAKKVCHDCIACQRQDSRACDQPMAPLPGDRIHNSPPFSVVGVDHAGPVFCSDTGDKKHYILLFTCAIVRAIHLELVPSLSLEDFLLAFRKFCARRGLPSVVYSDNAKTFKGADTHFQRLFGPNAPTWKFSAPLAPWWGGFWERLVRSTKSALRKSLGRESVSRSQFETVLTEVEGCINSRPLTYVEEDSAPLTPSHFLLGRSTPFVLPSVANNSGSLSSNDLVLKNKQMNKALENFWSVWNDQYIRQLPPLVGKKTNKNLEIGSLVLIREEGKPRLKWPLGKIVSLHHGRDGIVRAVSLKTENGEIVRAIQKLHKLEIENPQSLPEIQPVILESSKIESVNDEIRNENVNQRFSRKGRLIKSRKILDL